MRRRRGDDGGHGGSRDRSRRRHGSGRSDGLRIGGHGRRRLAEADGHEDPRQKLGPVTGLHVDGVPERGGVNALPVARGQARLDRHEPVCERDRGGELATDGATGVVADHTRIGKVADLLEPGERVRSHVGSEVEHERDGLARRHVDGSTGLRHVPPHIVDAGRAERAEQDRPAGLKTKAVTEPVPEVNGRLREDGGPAEVAQRGPPTGDAGREVDLPTVG